MSELICVDHKEYGLQETKAKEISEMFKPMLDKMIDLENEYNEVVGLDINKETCAKAKQLRLKYVKIRTGTAKIHKNMKDYFLQGGRFVDGWKNAQLMASQGIEEKLSNIENHFEILEKERMEKLQIERSQELSKYTDFVPDNLGKMADDVWQKYIFGTKVGYEARIEAEKKAEYERITKEREEREEQERIRKENERLKKEAEEREQQLAKEREAQRAEQERLENEARIEREKREAELEKERKERERIEAELKARQDAENAKIREEQEKAEREARKGDKAKINDLIDDLTGLFDKYSFKSNKNKAKYEIVRNLLEKAVQELMD